MRRSVRLRPWQKRALGTLAADPRRDFLAVATPGAGKTTFALTAAITDLQEHPQRRVVVVAPTQHLKMQWARAAGALGLHLEPQWTFHDRAVPADMHGVVVTYQQVAVGPAAIARVAADSFAIFDELHHAGAERAWGDALEEAFTAAGRRLALSGTPFRSDTNPIPFVRYDGDEACADYVYGYGDALGEGGVVRPVHFPRVDGEMEWVAPDGLAHSHTFADTLDRVRAGQRLRTALSVDGEWLPAVLDRAHRRLGEIRRQEPDAGGLVIAMDQDHARGVATLMADRLGIRPVVATSEDPDASARITRFGAGDSPWIVAVRMVSEGVDLPRLRVGVFATNIVTELFFRQAVGRLVRWRAPARGVATGAPEAQAAHFFIPDDERLRTYAARIAEERRHSLRRPSHDEEEPAGPMEEMVDGPADEQLSLFAAISAVAIGDPEPPGPAEPETGGAAVQTNPAPEVEEDPSLLIDLAPPPLRGVEFDEPAVPRQARKKDLRDENAARARELVRLTGMTHAQVNRELNRLAGVRRVAEATVSQLRARVDQADRWMRRL